MKINDVSKRFTVTLPDSVFENLELLAQAQGRPTANLAAFLIEVGISQIKERGEFPASPKSTKPKDPKQDV
jgi:predicted DNA-binding protein